MKLNSSRLYQSGEQKQRARQESTGNSRQSNELRIDDEEHSKRRFRRLDVTLPLTCQPRGAHSRNITTDYSPSKRGEKKTFKGINWRNYDWLADTAHLINRIKEINLLSEWGQTSLLTALIPRAKCCLAVFVVKIWCKLFSGQEANRILEPLETDPAFRLQSRGLHWEKTTIVCNN